MRFNSLPLVHTRVSGWPHCIIQLRGYEPLVGGRVIEVEDNAAQSQLLFEQNLWKPGELSALQCQSAASDSAILTSRLDKEVSLSIGKSRRAATFSSRIMDDRLHNNVVVRYGSACTPRAHTHRRCRRGR